MSGNDTEPPEIIFNLYEFVIMEGGINPKYQPIHNFIGKVFKGYYIYYYDVYMLSETANYKYHPITTRCHLYAQWVVKACNKVSESLIIKYWMACGYIIISNLENVEGSINTTAKLFEAEILKIMETAGGKEVSNIC